MPIIWEPEWLAGPNGTDFVTMLNTRYNWTDEFIAFMRESRQFGKHEYHCMIEGQDTFYGETKYPEFQVEYKPENPCVL